MLRDIRTNYQKDELSESSVQEDPLKQFYGWLDDAIKKKIQEPTAMVLSTIDGDGNPDSRVVLLKEITSEGFIFFTNYNSKKGQQISVNQQVSIVFFWSEAERQVRIKGIAEKISEKESDAYFLSRPLESQLGAWASPQSQLIESRRILDDNYSHYQEYFQHNEIKKPPHWGGFLIRPEYFEFWQGRPNRLHDRLEYILSGDHWIINRLAP
jgi:pyridoxamine 5'-phosphate oxidase